ncbi:MAG: hypothetical protein NC310_00295 [Roseburia sp.]|nr:hypothetical protein [Anaeroplasma bactoclasticum]MCM1195492.1 hypothetical protein [Roseburia sp.]MCM1556870.1 hypothetical protein [Anaeroplasma bactoclasticum]
MTYDLTKEEKENLKPTTEGVNDTILDIVLSYLNADKELFHINELTKDMSIKTDDLLPEGTFANGVMQVKNIALGQTLKGTLVKDALFTILLPLNENNRNYMNAIDKAILNLNRAIFEKDADEFIFDKVEFNDGNRLSEPIDGMEYELVYIEAVVRCSESMMMATEQSIKIDDTEFEGNISIIYGVQKTTDGVVSSNPKQKNTVNGIQITLTVDAELSRNDKLHQKLFLEADQDINYNVKFYTGYSDSPKEYTMKLGQFTSNGIIGDSVKAQFIFIMGDE